MARARRGDPAAFDELVRGYLRPAYAVALAIVGRPADAEDIAQDAFCLAFEKLDTCRDPGRFSGWLLTIVKNQARNWLAKRKLRDVSRLSSPPEQPDEGDGPDTGALREPLLAALNLLGEAQREVVLLHDLEGWTHGEIAGALGISEVMSRQHLFVARKKLRAELEGGLSEERKHG
ncbi:MAG: sigma-70 family RNA polymerase sigma factor [Polyangiaceae bacterium]|nr:sigma-70 family RNA polymerase sigma factor [Polyangiaceae bacterium]